MKSKLFLISYVILFMLIPVLGLAQAKGDAKAGKEKYDSLCGGCHGTSGKGDGSAAGGLSRGSDSWGITFGATYAFKAIPWLAK